MSAAVQKSPASEQSYGNVSHDLPPPVVATKKAKGKKEKPSAEDNAKLIQARLAQLEQEKAGERTQQAEVDREVKKESRHVDEELGRIEDPLERAEAVKKKYDALFADMKKLEREYTKAKKKADQLQKDKDKATSEFTKVNVQKDKMEKLSRTFQQENKKLKDDNKRFEETDRQTREIVNERLDSLLYDVQDVMNSRTTTHSENLSLELDELIKTRCKVLFDQSELREMHFKTILRHKDAEIGYLAAKHEVERKRADQEAARCRTLTNQVSTFSHTEAELRSQLNIYVEKFKQVEDTLNNSNELFLTFRKEMEEMSKKTKMLEKENGRLTRKHDQVKSNILQMAQERDRHLKEIDKLNKADQKMRNIIKVMQEQGRGGPIQQQDLVDDEDDEGTESEYEEDDDDYDEEEEEDDGSLGEEEGEDGLLSPVPPQKAQLGPDPPPPSLAQVKSNGAKGSTVVNGLKH